MESIMTNEIWKDVKGYEGRYAISNHGNIRSLWHEHSVGKNNRKTIRVYKEKMVAITDNGKGYKIASLSKNGKRKNHYVHRLVAESFLGEIQDGIVVNHKDFDMSNNNVSNLELCTQKDNILYSLSKGRGKRKPRKASSGEPYIYLSKRNTFIVSIDKKEKTFPNIKTAIEYRDNILRKGANNGE